MSKGKFCKITDIKTLDITTSLLFTYLVEKQIDNPNQITNQSK